MTEAPSKKRTSLWGNFFNEMTTGGDTNRSSSCCRKADVAGLHHWRSDRWPGFFCQHWWARCYGWRARLSVGALTEAFHFTALTATCLGPNITGTWHDSMLSSPFIEYNLMKLIAHENEGLLQVQLQTFYKYSKNSTYSLYWENTCSNSARKWWIQN